MDRLKRGTITIGREYGSGGRMVAKIVADRLGIPFYDKELIEMAARETGFSEDFIKSADENRSTGFVYAMYSSPIDLPLHDKVFIAQANIIKKVASDGPCVIVGRCSNYILAGMPNTLHVFLHAPDDQKIARARDSYGVTGTDEEIAAEITKQDKRRASYYNSFTMRRWGAADQYDLSLSTSLGLDDAAEIIMTAAKGARG